MNKIIILSANLALGVTASGMAPLAEAAVSGTVLNPESGALLLVAAAFGVGLLLTFTPCVLPLIPIVSAIIVSQDDQKAGRFRGGVLSVSYVFGTVVAYAIIGAMAGATGDHLQAYFQTPLVLGVMAALFVAGALSMFGLYEIRLPSAFESRMHESTSRLGGGKIGTVFVLGVASALVVGACVTPLLIPVLGVAIAAGDPVLGAVMMASMALGMGVVLIAIGFGLLYALPKSGAWTERVKHVLGVMLVAAGIYLLGFIPEVPVLFLWAALLIVLAVYLGATDKNKARSAGLQRLSKGAGILVLVWGVFSMVGAMYGNRDIVRPLPQMTAFFSGSDIASVEQATLKSGSLFIPAKSLDEFDSLLATAKLNGKAVLVDFYADWCLDCKRLDNTTFRDASVVAILEEKFTNLKIDVTNPDDEFGRALRKRFKVFGPPALVFFDSQGTMLDSFLTYGYLNVEEMIELLSKV